MTGRDLALSIRQPWPELILQGRKTVELRTWDADHRGPFWLHAGLAADVELDRAYGVEDPPRGAFVGRVSLVDILPLDSGRWERWRDRHLDRGPYRPGLFAWILSSPERLRAPVPARGQLKLFGIDDAAAQALRNSIDRSAAA